MFRTITAKYAGICRRCHHDIRPGDRIRYAGPGRTYHLAANCSGAGQADDTTPHYNGAEDLDTHAIAIADGADPSDPAYAPTRYARPRYGSRYTRFSSGAETFTNARGRCEDAPCCGCCS